MGKHVNPGMAALAALLDREPTLQPEAGQHWLALNALCPQDPRMLAPAEITWVQPWRGHYLDLESAGLAPVAELPGATTEFHAALMFTGRATGANRASASEAWNRLRHGGVLIAAGEKHSGIGSLENWLAGRCQIEGRFSKHHARIVWARCDGTTWPAVGKATEIDGFHVAPGVFSADGPDPGSQLLARHFDQRIAGTVADLGAGWGFLGARLLENGGAITELACFEADWHALQLAGANLAPRAGQTAIRYCWQDIPREPLEGSFDWIVMNPPFHAGRMANPDIGVEFIATAARILRKGGGLMMVANRHLPYEAVLQEKFRTTDILAEEAGFRVTASRR